MPTDGSVTAAAVQVIVLGSTCSGTFGLYPDPDANTRTDVSGAFQANASDSNFDVVQVSSAGKIKIRFFGSCSPTGGTVRVKVWLRGYYTGPTYSTPGSSLHVTPATTVLDTLNSVGTIQSPSSSLCAADDPIPAQDGCTIKVAGVGGIPSTGLDGVAAQVIVYGGSASTGGAVAVAGSSANYGGASVYYTVSGRYSNFEMATYSAVNNGSIYVYNSGLDDVEVVVRVHAYQLTPTVPTAASSVSRSQQSTGTVVTWQPPATDGRAATTGYVVTATPPTGGTATVMNIPPTVLTTTLPGVSRDWGVSVAAKNDLGQGPSAPAADVTNSNYFAVTPTVLFSTTSGEGLDPEDAKLPLAAGEQVMLSPAGLGGIPAGRITAVALDVRPTNATSSTSLFVWPSDQAQPTSPVVTAGAFDSLRASLYATPDSTGNLYVSASAPLDVEVIITGYFANMVDDLHAPVTPFDLTSPSDGSTTPWLGANYQDADGDIGSLTFTVTKQGASAPAASATVGSLVPGEQGLWRVPPGSLQPGNSYNYSVTASDGTLQSSTSTSVSFSVTSPAGPTKTPPTTEFDYIGVVPTGENEDLVAMPNAAGSVDSYKVMPGFAGPYFNEAAGSGPVQVLSQSVTASTTDTWSAMGLVRNDSASTLAAVGVTATLRNSTGSVLEVVTADSVVGSVRPGEPVPFSISASSTQTSAVASVDWSTTSPSRLAVKRDLVPVDKWSLPAGTRSASTHYPWIDQGAGPYPYVNYGSLLNPLSSSVSGIQVVEVWLDANGKVVALSNAVGAMDDTGPVSSLSPGAAADYVVSLPNSTVSQNLPEGSDPQWEMNS